MAASLPIRSIDADAATLGPATRLFYAEGDSAGCLRYCVENRGMRTVSFGSDYAESLWAVFDQIVSVAFFRPPSVRLRAFGSFVASEPSVFLLGGEWGVVLRDGGERVAAADPAGEFRRILPPIHYAETGEWLTLRFTMNVHYRELFTREVRLLMDPDMTNAMEIYFEIPSGEYVKSLLMLQDKISCRVRKRLSICRFPLVWPPSDLLLRKGDHTGISGVVFGEEEKDFAPRPRPAPRERRRVPPRKTASRAETADLPSTLHLPEKELVEAIRGEENEGKKWALIETNLALCSAGRTYCLLCHFGDLIGEKTAAWPVERLAHVFGKQPGRLLAPMAWSWPLDAMLILADQNPEREFLMEWLSERETERLMAMDPSQPVRDAASARTWLGISPRSPVSEETVKRIWRRLLGFLKSDYGRSRERAVHQKKDEIAKRLNQARDLLVKR